MSITIFAADDGIGGFELWSTDGTTGRTSLIKDIRTGATGSDPGNPDANFSSSAKLSFAVLNGYAYFRADDGVHGSELWRTDGTAAGTVQVTDMSGTAGYQPASILSVNGHLIFRGLDAAQSTYKVYVSDGTPGATPTIVATPAFFAKYAASGTFYYWAQDGDATTGGLFATDGVNGAEHLTTNSGYTTLLDANGTLYAQSASAIERVVGDVVTTVTGWSGAAVNLVNAGGAVYFETGSGSTLYKIAPGAATATLVTSGLQAGITAGSAAALGSDLIFVNTDAAHGTELWRSDGTAGGTVLLKDTLTGPAVNGRTLLHLTTVGNLVFFDGNDGKGGIDLWRTDGTANGTILLKHIATGNADNVFISPPPSLQNMTASGGILYFSASDGLHGTELWRSDGTALGTVQIAINAASQPGSVDTNGYPNSAALGGSMLFTGSDPANGYQLWSSDGTPAGTHLLAAIGPGTSGAAPRFATAAGAQVFFAATDGSHGMELWATDGSAAGTHMARDIAFGGVSSDPARFAAFGSSALFTATDGSGAIRPWISSGTTAGTYRLADVAVPGTSSDTRPEFVVAGSKAYFSADFGDELWVTDGTTAGTHVVMHQNGSGFGNGLSGAVLGGSFYFAADDGNGAEVWKTDGTPAGTAMVKDIFPPGTGRIPTGLTTLGSHVLFFADTNPFSYQLWTTDGSAAGTHTVDSTTWTTGQPAFATVAGGNLFFLANTGAAGDELWVSNGTATTLIDIRSGTQSSDPRNFTAFNNALYFTASDATNNIELWTSDGTLAGTHMVKDINTGGSSNPAQLTVAGSQLFFTAFDSTHGQELWVSDGTGGGTHLVLDIAPGIGAGAVASLHAVGTHVEFFANDGVHGTETWISDGTTGGTFMATDAVTPGSSSPSGFATLPGTLDTGAETLNGTAQADYLDGATGNDTLNGLAGDDVLTGGAGNDTIDGGDGNDTVLFTGRFANQPTPDESFTFDFATTTIVVTDARGGTPDGTDTLTHVETIKFADGYVTFDLADVHSWQSNAVILDTQGSVVRSTFGLDNGGAWSNFVDTANAASVLWSSTHFDAAGNAIETTTTFDDGTHTLTLFDNTGTHSYVSATLSFDASWNQTGMTELNDDTSTTLRPGEVQTALDTTLWFVTPYDADLGTPVSNTLSGGANADVFYGFGGDDTLSGGGGNDILNGGSGNDVLSGGEGDDRFLFSYGDGNDIVTDFVAGNGGNDTIVLHNYDATNFASLQMAQIGADTVITFDTYNHIVLQNVFLSDLNAGDFAFV